MESTLSRPMALRVSLAARALPDVDVRLLLQLLLRTLQRLDELSIQTLTVKQLKQLLSEADVTATRRQVEAALRELRGDGETEEQTAPETVPFYAEEWPHSIRLAVASNTGTMGDGHFGSCSRFLIYQVAPNRSALVEVRSALQPSVDSDRDAADERVALIGDCQLLIAASIGGPAAAKVIKNGIFPLKEGAGRPAAEVAAELSEVLAHNPPPWLARALRGEVPEATSPRGNEAVQYATD